MNNKITFILPTCEPDEMFKWLLPSLKNLQLAKDYINFAICFQPPYTEDQLNKIINDLDILGFEYKYFYKDYQVVKPFVPLLQIRNECAMLYPDSLVYGLLDDDMAFIDSKVTSQLKYILELFKTNHKLAVINCKGAPYDYNGNCFATDRGLYYRGGTSYGFEGLMPDNLYKFSNLKELLPQYQNESILSLFGGYQDKLCALVRILNGGEGLLLHCPYVTHTENRKIKGALGHRWLAAQEIPGSIAQFIIKYICKDFLQSKSARFANDDIIDRLSKNEYNYIYFKAKQSRHKLELETTPDIWFKNISSENS